MTRLLHMCEPTSRLRYNVRILRLAFHCKNCPPLAAAKDSCKAIQDLPDLGAPAIITWSPSTMKLSKAHGVGASDLATNAIIESLGFPSRSSRFATNLASSTVGPLPSNSWAEAI